MTQSTPSTLTQRSVVGPSGSTPQRSSTDAGLPQAPVPCAFVSRSAWPATTSGRRTMTAAQSASVACGAASNTTGWLQPASAIVPATARPMVSATRRSPRRGRGAVGWGIAGQATVSGMEAAARPDSPPIGELGESHTLARILPRLSPGDASLLGAGDDAAVVAAADGRYVVTTDLLVHGPDFRLAWSTPFELGWKAAATNLTDVAAMGARPTALVVAIAAPRETPITVLEGIADGLREALAA